MCTGGSFLQEPISSLGQVEIMCQFRRDCVSISFGALKPRSHVDFARCSLEFGSDLGRERGDKIHRKSFLNSLKEIVQRSEFRGSENTVRSRPDRVRSTGMHDMHRRSPVDRGKEVVVRCGRPTGTQ